MATYWYDIAGECWLYRLYSSSGDLLYVGVSRNLEGRFAKHRYTKPWWGEVATVTSERFATRARAFAAERAAIVAESPRYNVARPKVAA